MWYIYLLERDLLDALGDLDLEGEQLEITHTLPFKCIGAAHEKEYQESLEAAHLVLHEEKGMLLSD